MLPIDRFELGAWQESEITKNGTCQKFMVILTFFQKMPEASVFLVPSSSLNLVP